MLKLGAVRTLIFAKKERKKEMKGKQKKVEKEHRMERE